MHTRTRSFSTKIQRTVLFSFLAFLIAACQVTPTPIPTPPPTQTPVPTIKPTATPTATPLPSPTPISTDYYLQKGDEAFWVSDFTQAEEAYRQAIRMDYKFAPAYSHLALLYSYLPIYRKEALEMATKATNYDSENAEAWAILSLISDLNSQYGQILELAEKAVELDDESPLAHIALAKAYLIQNNTEAALEELESAKELNMDNVYLWLYYAEYANQTAEYDRSIQYAEKAVSLEPKFIPALLALAASHKNAFEYQEAEEYILKALEIQPDNFSANLSLADLYSIQDRFEEALEITKNLADVAVKIPDILATTGWIYYRNQELAKATGTFHNALYIDPDYIPALTGYGMTQLADDACEDAIDTFNQILDINPASTYGHLGLAKGLECTDEMERAEQGYKNAQKYSPHNPDVLISLALWELKTGNSKQAIEYFQEALARNMKEPLIYDSLGNVYLNDMSDFEVAEANFNQALIFSPTDQLALVGLGRLYIEQKEYQKAIDIFEQALESDKENAQIYFEMGVAYNLNQDYENAITNLRLAESMDFSTPELYKHLGRALRFTGQYAEAAEAYYTFLDLAPEGSNNSAAAGLAQLLESGDYPLGYDAFNTLSKESINYLLSYLSDYLPSTLVSSRIETIDEKPTLKIIFDLGSEQIDDQTLFYGTMFFIGVGAALVPFSANSLDGGLMLVLQDSEGNTLVEAGADKQTCEDLADGLIAGDVALIERIWLRDHRRLADATTPEQAIEEIKVAVEKDRNLKAKEEVEFQFMTSDELRQHIEEVSQDNPEEEIHGSQDLLILLDLLDAGADLEQIMIDVETNQISGFYDLEDKTFYVISDNDDGQLTIDEELTYAHEYMHALQDQYHGLSEIDDDESLNDDQQMAFKAVAEGEATEVSRIYYENHFTPLEQMVIFQTIQEKVEELPDDTPSFISDIFSLPYEMGLDFIQAVSPGSYWPDIENLYRDLPESTEQILHPEKYKDERDDPQEVTLPITVDDLGEGWKELDNDVMGEYFYRSYLSELLSPDLAMTAAAGWDGDRYAFYENETTGSDVLVWKTVWDSIEDAREYVSVYHLIFSEENGYQETERTLHGGDRTLRWEGSERSIYLCQKGDVTWLLYASQPDDLDLVVPMFKDEIESSDVTI